MAGCPAAAPVASSGGTDAALSALSRGFFSGPVDGRVRRHYKQRLAMESAGEAAALPNRFHG